MQLSVVLLTTIRLAEIFVSGEKTPEGISRHTETFIPRPARTFRAHLSLLSNINLGVTTKMPIPLSLSFSQALQITVLPISSSNNFVLLSIVIFSEPALLKPKGGQAQGPPLLRARHSPIRCTRPRPLTRCSTSGSPAYRTEPAPLIVTSSRSRACTVADPIPERRTVVSSLSR